MKTRTTRSKGGKVAGTVHCQGEELDAYHRPLIVAVESLLTADGPAFEALARSEGILLGCSGIIAISFFASSQASKFCQNFSEHLDSKGQMIMHLLAPFAVAARHADCHLP